MTFDYTKAMSNLSKLAKLISDLEELRKKRTELTNEVSDISDKIGVIILSIEMVKESQVNEDDT